MMFEQSGSRVIATKNHNRNMVLALLQRVPLRRNNTPLWETGLARFGVRTIFGIGNTTHLFADDFPYDWPYNQDNDNDRPTV